jgi:cardiolipin synthase A/B
MTIALIRNFKGNKWFFSLFLALLTILAYQCAAGASEGLSDRVLGFHNNEEGSPLIPLIDSAKSSIDIEIYEMDDPDVIHALSEAVKRHVKVQVIQEPAALGETCVVFKPISSTDHPNCRTQKELLKEVRQSGGQYVPFNKSELCGISGKSCFQHGKIAIFDRASVMISTGNFNSTNLCNLKRNPNRCDRDYSIVTDDSDVISALIAVFEKDLQGKRFDPRFVMTPPVTNKITISPISLEDIIRFIGSARETIQVQNQYLEEPRINSALVAAARKGVKVSITVSSACSFGSPTPHKASEITQIYSEFDQAGVSSQFFTKHILVGGTTGYLHAKAIIVDGSRAWVGSMNGSTESATMNREYGIYFGHAGWVSALGRVMQADHQNPNSETWQESIRCAKD